jgi:preprotein translocase subunit SecB
MRIQFKNIQFTEVKYDIFDSDEDITSNLNLSLNIRNIFKDEQKNDFAIEFLVDLHNESKSFIFHLKAVAYFSTPDEIDEDFKKSPFIAINAPAIAFPYVRAFISTVTINSGYNPVVLPSLNFVQLAEEKQKQSTAL